MENLRKSQKSKKDFFFNLGVITVPRDYEHSNKLSRFKNAHSGVLRYFDESITDENFKNPSLILEPNKKLLVLAFVASKLKIANSDEALDFLSNHKSVYPGPQGTCIVWKLKGLLLPQKYSFVSLDQKDRLPLINDIHRVLEISGNLNSDWCFKLRKLNQPFKKREAFLGFFNVDQNS